jgi:hypothetical protein
VPTNGQRRPELLAVARNGGAALAPLFPGAMLVVPTLGLPFLAAGEIRIIYDLWIFACSAM